MTEQPEETPDERVDAPPPHPEPEEPTLREGEDGEPAERLWTGPREQLPGGVRADHDPDTGRRLLPGWNRPDPWRRPKDPAGSFPRYEPRTLLPETDEPLVIHARPAVALPTPGAIGGTSAAAEVGDGPLPEPPQAARFQFVLGAMIAVAVAGVLLLGVALVGSGGSSSGDRLSESGRLWSAWAPTSTNAKQGASQIAQHVGAEYKLPSGKQIVAVTGGPLEVAGLPLTVALRQSAAQGGQIQLFNGTGVLYRLCGLGDKCAISEGRPSEERHLLLRREALELALYSFRYLKGVDQVVVFMPPKKGDSPEQALFFRPQDVASALNQPLNSTLAGSTPGVTNMTTSPNAALVNRLTLDSLFKFSLTQANSDNRAFLVLDK